MSTGDLDLGNLLVNTSAIGNYLIRHNVTLDSLEKLKTMKNFTLSLFQVLFRLRDRRLYLFIVNFTRRPMSKINVLPM